jgi:hypothetical protein
LRRAALGAVRLLSESADELSFPLDIPPAELLRRALRVVREQQPGLASSEGKAEPALLEFFTERLRFLFSRAYRYDELNAVFAAAGLDRPVSDLAKGLEALSLFRARRTSRLFRSRSSAWEHPRGPAGDVDPAFFSRTTRRSCSKSSKIRPGRELIASGHTRSAAGAFDASRRGIDSSTKC